MSIVWIIDQVWSAKPKAVSCEAVNPRHSHECELFKLTEVLDDMVLGTGSDWVKLKMIADGVEVINANS